MVPYESVKCLSVWQPWAWAIVAGHKSVENRSWPTEYRGPLLIHASKTRKEMGDWTLQDPERAIELTLPEDIAFGALVGIVNVVDCTRQRRNAWHVHGQVGWYLEQPIQFEKTIPMRGERGLFNVSCPSPMPNEWPMYVE